MINIARLIGCVGVLICTGAAFSATASLADSAPADRVLVDAGGPSHASANVQFNRTINIDRFGGVAFPLMQDSSIESATFHIHGVGEGAGSASAIVSVIALSDLSESTLKKYPYEVVATEAVNIPAEIQAGRYITLRFEKPLSLKKGNYGVVFQWAKAAQGREINFRTSQANNGNWYFRNTMNKDGDVIKQEVAGGATGRGLFVVIQGDKSKP